MAQLDPPVPISATEKTGVVTIRFDKPLVNQAIDFNNWIGRFAGQAISGIGSSMTMPDLVRITYGIDGLDPGPDLIGYFPPPFDVVSQVGLVEADGFVDFPIT